MGNIERAIIAMLVDMIGGMNSDDIAEAIEEALKKRNMTLEFAHPDIIHKMAEEIEDRYDIEDLYNEAINEIVNDAIDNMSF